MFFVVDTAHVRAQVTDGQLIQTPDGALYVIQDGQLHAITPTQMEFQQVLGVPVGAPVSTGVQIIGSPVPAPPAGASSGKFVDEHGTVTTATPTNDEVLRSERFVPGVSRVQVCREVSGTFSGSDPDVSIFLTNAATISFAGTWFVRSPGSQCATVAVQPGETYYVVVDARGFQGQWHVTAEPAP
jgi:hypothetical protein